MSKIVYRFRCKDDECISPWFTLDDNGVFAPENFEDRREWEWLLGMWKHFAHELPGEERSFCLLGWSAPYPEALRALCCALRVSPPFDNAERETPIPYEIEEVTPNPATLDPQYADPFF